MTFTRRLFLRWSAFASAAATAVPLLGRRLIAQQRAATQPRELKGLEMRKLLPVAYVVLPAELGPARIERATIEFARWIANYKEDEETLHPYGSDRLGATGRSPAAVWAEQLAALDTMAGARDPHGHPFALTTNEIKHEVLSQALAGLRLTARVPAPLASPHVAIAMLSRFLESPEAHNLAYERTIDPKSCRPLPASPKEPVALRRAGRGA
jgi:hypothetical protein